MFSEIGGRRKVGYKQYKAKMEGGGIGWSFEDHFGISELQCSSTCSNNDYCYGVTTVVNATLHLCRLHYRQPGHECILLVPNPNAIIYARVGAVVP